MAELPLDQAIPRFKANESRADKFVNGADNETWNTSGGQVVPSIQKFLKDKDTEINAAGDGILAQTVAARDISVISAASAESDREAAEAAAELALASTPNVFVADRAALKAVDTDINKVAWLTEVGRAGQFHWRTGDYASRITADSNEGIYVKADAVAASTGAWVRQFDFQNYYSRWFGAVADHATDNTAVINSIIAAANTVNTLTTPGRQSAAFIEIEGGVRFAATDLTFLPSGNWVYVYLRFFSQSNTTRGIPDGGGGTNERVELSVNSGFPGDASGGMVAEWKYEAPLHPAIILNAAKNYPGADAHFGTGQVRLPAPGGGAVRASLNIKDEGVLKYRLVYEQAGDLSRGNMVSHAVRSRRVALANVGSTGWPTLPANGVIVTGVTSGAKLLKTTHTSSSITGHWLSGTFIPGEKVTDGVTQSTNSITGGGVSETNVGYAPLAMSTQKAAMAVGMWPGDAITAFSVGGRLTVAPNAPGIADEHAESTTRAAILFSNDKNVAIANGKQIVLGPGNELLAAPGVGVSADAIARLDLTTGAGFILNTGAIQNIHNIESGSRTGTGQYVVQFLKPLLGATYVVSLAGADQRDKPIITSRGTNSFTIQNYNHADLAAADLRAACWFTVTGGGG